MATNAVKFIRENGIDVIEFAPGTELESNTLPDVQPALFDLVEKADVKKIVLDMENLRFASSQALGCLVTLRLKAARTGARLVMAAVPPQLQEIVSLTQIDKLYQIFPTRAAAIQSLAAG